MLDTRQAILSGGTGAVAVGAVGGIAIRFAALAAWPSQTGMLISTLLFVCLAAAVAGAAAASEPTRRTGAVATAAVGAAASVSLVAILAIISTPLWCVAYLTLCPAIAMTGLACGVAGAMAINRRRKPVAGDD